MTSPKKCSGCGNRGVLITGARGSRGHGVPCPTEPICTTCDVPGVPTSELTSLIAPFTGGVLEPFKLAEQFEGNVCGPDDVDLILEDSGGTAFRMAAIANVNGCGQGALMINAPGKFSFQQPWCSCFDIEIVEFSAEQSQNPNIPPPGEARLEIGWQPQQTVAGNGSILGLSSFGIYSTTTPPPLSDGQFFNDIYTTQGSWNAVAVGPGLGTAIAGTTANIKVCWDPETTTVTMARDGVIGRTITFTYGGLDPKVPPLPFLGYFSPYFRVSASSNGPALTQPSIIDILLSNYCLNGGTDITIPLPGPGPG